MLSTAGAGTGRIPCCVLTVPLPVATGREYTFSLSRFSRYYAYDEPIISATASAHPTSWKCN